MPKKGKPTRYDDRRSEKRSAGESSAHWRYAFSKDAADSDKLDGTMTENKTSCSDKQ